MILIYIWQAQDITDIIKKASNMTHRKLSIRFRINKIMITSLAVNKEKPIISHKTNRQNNRAKVMEISCLEKVMIEIQKIERTAR